MSKPYYRLCTFAGLKKGFLDQGRATPENVEAYARAWLKKHGLRTVSVSKGGRPVEWVVRDMP